ncbi:hypothetical protein [Streptomyces lydicus]|uniref:hypothetical protein n=1 Tax=Streptomyces lydicus TaxID=47763 RepID=UPI0036E9DBD4
MVEQGIRGEKGQFADKANDPESPVGERRSETQLAARFRIVIALILDDQAERDVHCDSSGPGQAAPWEVPKK